MATHAQKSRKARPKKKATTAVRPGGADAGDKGAAERERDKIRMNGRAFAPRPTEFGTHTLDILPDMPDIRDRIYRPHLRAL